ncbi:DUF6624 domain-containing protein [Leeuwenhoekiella nanhaiensis]|uniref:Uncharacterized protein n=1 Tax=Leeuwenhoekiella nanhaiensis TaxID=1655491 RepID=A0A2G1VR49_9FLAO|nr:DUF6624 domain-containing protein [Leeuwenhoekiella nanhaiensis]PHQ29100.1 hypothetical protein CJ305_10840 [Leeuwenhoekiella nanhaiensis]
MKIVTLQIAAVFLCFFASYAQEAAAYDDLILEANRLYQSQKYSESGKTYEKAFNLTGDDTQTSDRYNAACSWALADEADKAFKHLFIISRPEGYTNYSHISQDTDLTSLHNDTRWDDILTRVKQNREEVEQYWDKPLVAVLDSVHQSDQSVRKTLGALGDQHGWQSEEVKAQWKKVDRVDSINLIKVKRILDEHGWLGSDVLGDEGNMTLFLVIQHSDLEIQENYLPLLQKAVSEGNTPPHFLALLQDRIEIRNDRPQIYGSQVGRTETGEAFVAPMIDPDHVDERRASIGLDSMESYLSNFDMEWDLEAYKRSLKSPDKNE